MWARVVPEEVEVGSADQSFQHSVPAAAAAGRRLLTWLCLLFSLGWGPLECVVGRGCCLPCGGWRWSPSLCRAAADTSGKSSFLQWAAGQVDGHPAQVVVRTQKRQSSPGALKFRQSWGCVGGSYTGRRSRRHRFSGVLAGRVSVVLLEQC